ncbi:MAG: redoxin domain-containing protein [Clostridia bacterium]|nr:redoxin domain-containing protein [Clostridia bacterium]
MKNKTKIVGLVILLISILGIALFAYNKLSDSYNKQPQTTKSISQEKETASDDEYEQAFDVTIYNATGDQISLTSLFEGKPTIVNFWASWCGPCKSEMPEFQSVYESMGDEVNFVMINLTDNFRETQKNAEKFIGDNEYTFPVYFDKDMDASDNYAIYSIPTTLFINADGKIVNTHSGTLTEQQLIQGIDEIK